MGIGDWGLGPIPLGMNIFLFGGFDSQNLFNDFYIVTFKDKGFFKDIENNNKIVVILHRIQLRCYYYRSLRLNY